MRRQLKRMRVLVIALVMVFQILPITTYAEERPVLTEEVVNYLSEDDYAEAYKIAEEEGVFDRGYTLEELDEYFISLYIRMYENKVRLRMELPDEFNKLNSQERWLVLIYPSQAATVYMCSKTAEQRTVTEYGYSLQDDCSNAFKHAFWNALMTNSFASSELIYNVSNGRMYAEMWANAHEADNQGTLPCQMDLYNNNVGRNAVTRLSSTNELQSIIREKVDDGLCKYIKNGVLCDTYNVD